jgi:hypothetical protein
VKLRNRRTRPEPGDARGTWTLGPDTELYEPYDEITPYRVRAAHPLLHAAARVGLWGAVAVGCLGGLVGLASPGAGSQEAPREAAPPPPAQVPGPVAAVAERAVTAWLTATERSVLADLFVEAPPTVSGEPVTVVRADAVAGEAAGDGAWDVTVAVDVLLPPPEAEDDEEAEPVEATWYAAVTVVGDGADGLQALATPALVPAPPEVDGWRSRPRDARRLEDDHPLAVTITGFLEALVVGQGDPAPYLAPGVELAPVRPAPFTALEVGELVAQTTGEDEARVWAEAAGTVGRSSYSVAYQIDVVRRDGRWQVAAVSGAPTGHRVGADEGAGDDGPDGGGGSVSRPVPVNDPTAGTDTTTTTPGGPVTTLDDEALRGEGLPDEDGG